MCFWTPLFIVAQKMSWIDWSWWWIAVAILFDSETQRVQIKNVYNSCLRRP